MKWMNDILRDFTSRWVSEGYTLLQQPLTSNSQEALHVSPKTKDIPYLDLLGELWEGYHEHNEESLLCYMNI